MNNYTEMAELMERVIHKYNQWENMKRSYGTEHLFTRAEIHTIAAVGDHPGINITALAAVRGVIKGAASQMTYKLVDKGAIEKNVSPDSDTEVVLTLTESGQINYQAHKDYHQQTSDEFLMMLKELPEPLYLQMREMLTIFENKIDKLIQK